METLTLTTSIVIDAPQTKVWQALTDPELIKQYFFGTQLDTDWKASSPITWSGEWQGKKYKDKGSVVEITPGKYIKYTYWSSMSGKEDKPENYGNVTYSLSDADGKTKLTLTQDKIADEAAREHSEKSWQILLNSLKEMLENGRI